MIYVEPYVLLAAISYLAGRCLQDVGRRALAVEVASSHNLLAPHKLGQAAQEEVAELAALMACNTSLLWTLDEVSLGRLV